MGLREAKLFKLTPPARELRFVPIKLLRPAFANSLGLSVLKLLSVSPAGKELRSIPLKLPSPKLVSWVGLRYDRPLTLIPPARLVRLFSIFSELPVANVGPTTVSLKGAMAVGPNEVIS